MGENYVGSLDPFKEKMNKQGYSGLRHMGQRSPDKNAQGIVTGKVKYTHNVKLPGMHHAKFLRSPYGRAKIISIDTSKAESMPGVVKVLTGKSSEVAGKFNLGDEPLIAADEVSYDGQMVAAVVAETIEEAEDAVYAIDVKYERMDAITDVREAASLDPPIVVHTPRLIEPPYEAERPNVINCFYVRSGDIEKGFADADVIVEEEFDCHADPHAGITPPSAVAEPHADGTMTVWADVQNIYPVPLPTAAAAADLPVDKVNLIGPEVCAGGFGGKNCGVHGVYAALLAKITNRPVRVMFDVSEWLNHATRPWTKSKIKVGATNDGKFTAVEVSFWNGGPYARFMLSVLERSREALTCTYHWGHPDLYEKPNVMFTARVSYTNLCSTMSYRGFGVLEAQWPQETAISMLAEKLGMDPLELRVKNLVKEGDRSAQNEIVRSVGSGNLLPKVYEMMQGWGPKPSVPEPWVVGRGFSAANKYSQSDMVHNLIYLRLHGNGTVDIVSDAMDIGQGMNTISRQFVAEGLNIPIENVRKAEVDTAYVPWTSNSFSSSATVDYGGAAIVAAKNAREKLFEMAAPMLGVGKNDLETIDGVVRVKGNPDKSVTWADAFEPYPPARNKILIVSGGLNDPVGAPNDYDGPGTNDYYTGQALGPHYRLIMHMNWMANAAEVMVNKETGEIKVTKFVAGNDAIPVNPTLMEGQMIGGQFMATMNTILEAPIIDNGSYMSKTLLDWKIPSVLEMPKADDISTAIVPVWGEYFGENPRVDCPFGAKGIGEGVNCGGVPALIDALHDATGVWFTKSPVTPDMILKALGKG
ncbi:MAG: xanthine dehydrogenase family protein molybdopterin-binding subunit [Candidatus Bathyarchaeota archaeon]|nr:xanthine dehydrogenase family protein molybdopterin-binding subunit [Candidatus Bathyarchaeota archaeon]